MFERVRNWYRTHRYGGVTGLNYVSANAKMTSVIALPWLGGYIGCFMFVPDPFLELSITVMSFIWIMYCYGIYAYAKVDATKYKPFPQSQWRMPDGGTAKYDLMIPPNGFSYECEFEDGTTGWRVNLGRRYQYWDKRTEFPFVFDYALLRFPAKKPDICFQWLSEGEFFHKGIAIKDPSCEDISVYVHGWVQDKDGQYVPVGEVMDCSLRYERSLENLPILLKCKYCRSKIFPTDKQCGTCGAPVENSNMFRETDKWRLAFFEERNRRMMSDRTMETMEKMIEADKEEKKDFRKRVEDGMTKRRDLYKHITDTGKPLTQRIKENLWKIIGIFVFVVFVLWLFGVIRI